jgi:DNA-binding transcriptional MerR regulator
MTGQEIGIGDLARATGCKVQTIRYYEEIGLMPEPARTAGNQRRYNERHVDRLAFIRHSRELGFSLEPIRELLSLSDRSSRPFVLRAVERASYCDFWRGSSFAG